MKNPINISLVTRLLSVKYNTAKRAVENIESQYSTPKYMIWGTGGGRNNITKRNLESIKEEIFNNFSTKEV